MLATVHVFKHALWNYIMWEIVLTFFGKKKFVGDGGGRGGGKQAFFVMWEESHICFW